MSRNIDLFGVDTSTWRESIGPNAYVLHNFALAYIDELIPAIDAVQVHAPFRHMVTPGGFTMSVALTNCGPLGWCSDLRGYRYTHIDPQSEQPWPSMPAAFKQLAQAAATTAGFENFEPDACLMNRYLPTARMSLHQDKNEIDFTAPIVSVSLGIPAVFLFGGHARTDKAIRVPLQHGDVVVWGGADRLRYHGVMPLKESVHSLLGCQRINLTFRKAN
jgi:alkylated DNA repair protein (DNA oxidative demethylase)